MQNRKNAAPETLPRLLSLATIAERTDTPRPTWYSIVARGELPAVRIGRTVRVDERDFLAYLAARREGGR
jgi:excisionase family DNA binding protein